MASRVGIVVLTAVMLASGCGAPTGPRSDEAAPAPDSASQPRTFKRLIAAIQGDPPTLNEDITSAGGRGGTPGGGQLEMLISSGLVVSDDRRAIHLQLGEAIPAVENGLWKVLP